MGTALAPAAADAGSSNGQAAAVEGAS
jgi:hypothetical protein